MLTCYRTYVSHRRARLLLLLLASEGIGACSYPFGDYETPSSADASGTTGGDASITGDAATNGDASTNGVDATGADGTTTITTTSLVDGGAGDGLPATPPTPVVSCSSAAYPGTVCVPTTSFTLGAISVAACGAGGCADELPPTSVTVSSFAIDQDEVTVGRFAAFVKAGLPTPAAGTVILPSASKKSDFKWGKFWPNAAPPGTGAGCTWPTGDATLPVNCVDWFSALAFCVWDANKRLPTEAEWEAEASGGEERLFPWSPAATEDGDLPGALYCDEAQYGAPKCGTPASRVGDRRYGMSKHGAFDLAGSLAEWVLDQYVAAGWSGIAPSTDPFSDPSGTMSRGIRGGHYQSAVAELRAAARGNGMASSPSPTVGFRCAQRLP
jgi:formylglycine-generating enzyme required for sulfatase activity